MEPIKLSGLEISENRTPAIIAEMSGNHNQSLERALSIVEAAGKAGAHMIKLQTYTADTMTIKGAHKITDKGSLWEGQELHELYGKAYTPWEWHKEIFEQSRKMGMIPFSSPFDHTSVDFLEELNVEIYKIASFENTDIPLLEKVASTGKPVIMSTGATTLAQLDDAVNTLFKHGCSKLVLLKCTSTYPASPESTNLLTIPHMKELYGCQVGLSDHTMGIGVAIASVGLGASVIEKHFTLRRADGGVDSAFSIEPEELQSLVTESERAFLALGEVSYGVGDSEKAAVAYKRSIYVSKNLAPGDTLNADNIRVIRPGFGLEPKYYSKVIGRKVQRAVQAGTPLTWDIV